MENRMFTELPRYIGFPNQVYCEKKFAFDNFIKLFNGKAPLMVSTYQFKDRLTPIIDNMVFDIDSYFGMRIPYKNVQNLKAFCDKNNIPYIINFSGGKGFHFFMIIKDIIPKEEEKQIIKDKIYSCQEAIVKHCTVEAIDYPTMGRLHFLIRYPTSVYIRMHQGKPEGNGFYCRNIPSEDFEKGLKHIAKIAQEPGDIPKKPKATKSLDDIISLLPGYKFYKRTNGKDIISIARTGMVCPTIDAVGLPCLKEIATSTHPKHRERIELVSFLKFMGYSDIAINAFIKKLKWLDYKYAVTAYQVSTVRPRYPDCKYLKLAYNELCDKCTLKRRGN
jgi:hypothetical protein